MGGRGGGRQAACLPTFLLYHSLKWLGPLEGDLGERGRGGEEWERSGRGGGEEGRGREVRRGGTFTEEAGKKNFVHSATNK